MLNTQTPQASTSRPAPIHGPPADTMRMIEGSRWPQSYHRTYAAALDEMENLKAGDPETFSKSRLILAVRYEIEVEADYLAEGPTEISEDRFNDMLGVLPPLDWRQYRGVERFNCAEMTFGRITTQYAKISDRYFSKPVRHGDTSTYITPEVLAPFFTGSA